MTQTVKIKAQVPRAFKSLLYPARYKAAYGGRGGAKSHFYGEQLILRAFREPTRWACIREVQNTIRDSVRQLLVDKISKFGLEAYFDVKEREIVGANGSLIVFKGMQAYNAENIKSLEDFDGAWVEEAQTLSEKSLRLLRPTIRKDGSEIWFSWNPRNDTDPVDKFFRGKEPPKSAAIVEVGWRDNPWFPDVLREEMQHDYATDPEMATHVWGGGYEIVSEAAYYARLIARAEREGRIGDFPYDPSLPVDTAWDIGIDDYTSIWFIQNDGFEPRVIDFFETSGAGLQEIVRAALPEMNPDAMARFAALGELGRAQPFRYGLHYLPHDIKVREWGAEGRTRIETMAGLGFPYSTIRVGVQTRPEDRIAAARKVLPAFRFNRTSRVMAGVRHLQRFSRRLHREMNVYTGPLHDEHSHAADSFGEYAQNAPIRPVQEPEPPREPTPEELGAVRLPGAPEERRQGRWRRQ